MAKAETVLTFTVKVKPELSFRDAIKLRLAGGKYMQRFWDAFAERIRSDFKKGDSENDEDRSTD